MTILGYSRTTSKLLIAAIVLGFASVAFPWWNLVMFRNGKLTSTFILFLFGIVKQGFYRADLPFEWWSCATLVLVVIGAFSGSVGYKLLERSKNRQELIITEVAVTASGCLFYLVNLSYSLATSVNIYNSSYWMTSDRTVVIGPLQALGFRFVNMLNLWVLEFLSAGFFLAAISTILSSIVLYRLRKTPSASIHDNNACALDARAKT